MERIFFKVSLFLILLITNSIYSQVITRFSEDLSNEMKKFAENVMRNPDSLNAYILKSSKYFNYEEFIKKSDSVSTVEMISSFKKCKTEFFGMCKNEIVESHSNTLYYYTKIEYRNICEEKVIQFCWILEDSKWKLYSIKKTDYISCYPKEDNE